MISLRRKILFFTFVATFIIATPLISLYAAGYKINLKNLSSRQMVQKTGMLIIETKPEGATVYLNEKEQKEFLDQLLFKKDSAIKTPAKIKGLLPEEYNVRVELAGYWLWNKKLTVHSGQITHAQDIKLFKKDLPLKITDTPEEKIFISPDKKKIFLPMEGIVMDLKTENKTEAIKSKEKENISWSPDNKKILVGNTIFNLKDPEKNIYLDKLIGLGIKNVKWDKDSNKIYYQYKNSINYFNLTDKKSEVLIKKEGLLDYKVKDNYLFFISKNGLSIKLRAYLLDGKKTTKEIELPISDGYKLINPNHNLINLYDEKYKILYLIDPFSLVNPLEEIVNNIKYGQWVSNKTLLYANDFEIWKLNLEEGKKELLTRISQPISSIINTKESNYIMYSTKQTINVLECSAGGKIQVTELINLDNLSVPEINEDEDILYFNAKIGNQEGLYKLNI